MENREILIANTKTQKRSKITTNATTLGELKAALNEAGVDYRGMTFTEGISKTQLISNDTQLPQNVMYKGQPTNNLVILLTNTKKNIASGASDRQAAYAAVKDNDLQDAVKAHFGRNFTQVPTDALWSFITANINGVKAAIVDVPAEEPVDSASAPVEDVEDMQTCQEPDIKDNTASAGDKVAAGLFYAVNYYVSEKIMTSEEVKNLIKNLMHLTETIECGKEEWEEPTVQETVSTSDGSITNDDVDDMINDIL